MTGCHVLTGATLLDGTGAPPLPDARLVIKQGRIVEVGPVDAVPASPDATFRSLAGLWVLPGLIDAHLHLPTATVLDGLVGQGLTTVVDPAHPLPPRVPQGPDPEPASALETGAPTGTSSRSDARPAVRRAGPPIDGPQSRRTDAVRVATTTEARAAVHAQVDAGVHFIKVYSRLPAPLLAAAAAEARALGVRVIGDVAATSWLQAARFGVHLLCHACPQHPDLLPTTRRAEYVDGLRAGRVHPLVGWFERVDLQGPEVTALARALRDHGVALVPTLATLEAYVFGAPSRSEATHDCGASPPAGAAGPDADRDPVMPGWPPVPASQRKPTWSRVMGFLARLHQSGVPLLAGTDAPRAGVPAGASLWREIRLLRQVGLSPHASLTAATGASAAMLGLDDRGVLAPGRRADLLVLTRDPERPDLGPGDLQPAPQSQHRSERRSKRQ
jgi:hypothetical protein